MVFSVRKHLWNCKVGRLRLRRDRGPGICNGAMRSGTLQFGICAVRVRYSDYVMSLFVVIGAVRRRYSDYVMSLFVVHVHVIDFVI